MFRIHRYRIVVCVAVMLLGPGNAAVDRFFRFRRKPAA